MKKSIVISIYLILSLSVLLVFWQVRNFDFVNYDDNVYVYENSQVLNGFTYDGLISAFTSAPAYGNWLPLTWLSFMLDCQLFGVNPGKMHLVNVLLHIANTLLLFAVLKKMTGSVWQSAFVAAAFALHPMHVESVAWVTERKDVLSTFFLLLTLAAYTSYAKRPSVYRYVATLVIFELGLLAKPVLVTLPFILLLLDYWPLNRFETPQKTNSRGRKTAKAPPAISKRQILYWLLIEKIPFVILTAVSSIITFFVQRSGGGVIDIEALPFTDRVANAFLSYFRYIYKMFWPQNLAVFYPYDLSHIKLWQIMLCALLLFAISIFVIRFGRRQKYLPVGWFFFLGTLVPVIGLVQVAEQAMADHYSYIPYIGLFIIIAWGLPQLLSKWQYRKIALAISVPIVLAAIGITAYRQASYWKNDYTLFSHALEATQDNYLAYFSLGDYLREHGNAAAAVEYLKKALRIWPDYPDAVLALGCALTDQNDFAGTIEYFNKAIKLSPGSARAAYAHENIGIVLRKQGRLAEAASHFAQAVQLMPDFAEAHFDLANAIVHQGRLDEAAEHFRAAVRLRPGWVEPMNNLALIIATHPEIKNRDVNEAVSFAGLACRLTNYNNSVFLTTLAASYASAGRFAEAIDTANMALALADKANQPQLKAIIQYHLRFYTQGKPYIEPAPKPIFTSP